MGRTIKRGIAAAAVCAVLFACGCSGSTAQQVINPGDIDVTSSARLGGQTMPGDAEAVSSASITN